MTEEVATESSPQGIGFFEKYLTVWVFLCIGAGIVLGKIARSVAKYLDGLAIYVGEVPVVSIPMPLGFRAAEAAMRELGVG